MIEDVAGPTLDAVEECQAFRRVEGGGDEPRLTLMRDEIDNWCRPASGQEVHGAVHGRESRPAYGRRLPDSVKPGCGNDDLTPWPVQRLYVRGRVEGGPPAPSPGTRGLRRQECAGALLGVAQ